MIKDWAKNRISVLLNTGIQKVLGYPQAFEIGVLSFEDEDLNDFVDENIKQFHQNQLDELNKAYEAWLESKKPVPVTPFPEGAILFGEVNKEYGCFSNFYKCVRKKTPALNGIVVDGITYTNSEAAFQARKTLDRNMRKQFANICGSKAKELGRTLKLRPDWEEVKVEIMEEVLYAKFSQNPALKDMLLATGDKEIWENTTGWHDNFWGNCNCPRCLGKEGENHLGKALMSVREKIRSSEGAPEAKVVPVKPDSKNPAA